LERFSLQFEYIGEDMGRGGGRRREKRKEQREREEVKGVITTL